MRRKDRGMALLLVLLVVVMLTTLLTEFAFSTLVDLRLTETFRDNIRAYYLAKGGINAGRRRAAYGGHRCQAQLYRELLLDQQQRGGPVIDAR